MVLEGIKQQLFSPAVTEPYPLFLADRMVKSLGAGGCGDRAGNRATGYRYFT